MGRFGETEAEKTLDSAMFKRRGLLVSVAVIVVLAVMTPQIITWFTTYHGVVLQADKESIAYTTKRRNVRHTSDFRIEVGTAEGEPFWVHVDKELYHQVKIGTVVNKRLFHDEPEVATDVSGPEFAPLLDRYPMARH